MKTGTVWHNRRSGNAKLEYRNCKSPVPRNVLERPLRVHSEVVAAVGAANADRTERNRAFEAPELADLFTALERRLTSPAGDTLIAESVRRVP